MDLYPAETVQCRGSVYVGKHLHRVQLADVHMCV